MPTILVIEDDIAIQEAIVDILELQGFQVLSAPDGVAGVAQAREHRPDLILCDIMMPFLDGYGVLSRLRQYPQTATIPFIFLTARTTQADFRQGMQLGADDYLAKPFRPAELVAAINLRLQRQLELTNRFQKRVEALHSSLVTVLPHELRTPLNGVLGGISLLKDEFSSLEPSDAEELFIIVEQSALRLKRLVENCLLYAELATATAAGPADGDWTPNTCAAAAIIETVACREASAANREGDLILHLADVQAALPQASLAKAAEEVINNAFKYSERGAPVTVAASGDAAELCIVVTDQGRGMTRDELGAIGPFRQFNRSRFEQQGLGLGLAIAQHILHRYGGALAIESSPERGTTVRMTVRCAAAR